jgi:hypothetical protein
MSALFLVFFLLKMGVLFVDFRKKLAASMLATSMLATSFSVVGSVSTEFLVQKAEAATYQSGQDFFYSIVKNVLLANLAANNDPGTANYIDTMYQNVRTTYAADFDKVFGTDATVDKIFAILSETELSVRNQVDIARLIQDVSNGKPLEQVKNEVKSVYQQALTTAINNTDPNFMGKLNAVGLSVDIIADISIRIQQQIDPTYQALLALKDASQKAYPTPESANGVDYIEKVKNIWAQLNTEQLVAVNEARKNAQNLKTKSNDELQTIIFGSNGSSIAQNVYAKMGAKLNLPATTPTTTPGGGGGGGGTPATNNPTTETGKNVQDILKDANKTDQQKAEAIKEAVKKFVDSIKDVKDPAKATEAAKGAIEVVKNLGEALKVLKADQAKVEIVANVISILETSVNLLANATPEQTASLFASYAQELKSVVGAVDAKAAAQIKQVVQNMAKAAVERASTQEVDAGAIAEQLVTGAITRAKDAATKVNGALKDNGLGTGSEFKATVAFEIKGNQAEAVLSFTLSSVAKFVSENVANVSIKFGNGLKGTIDFTSLTGAKFVMAATDEAGKKDVPAGEVKIEANKLADKAPGANQQSVNVPAYQVKISVDGKQVDAVAKAVELSFDVPVLGKGVNAEKLGAFKEENGKWIPVGGRYDAATGTYTVKAKQTGTYTVYLSTKTFADIANVAWAKDAVEVMVAKGVLNGITEDKFAPNSDVTRAQFARMLVQTLGLSDASVDGATTFKDVKENDWFAKDVKIAASLGIVAGVKEDQFAPNAPITREQMAAMVARALKNVSNVQAGNTADALKKFKDANKISGWASEGVALVAEKGIVNGMSNGTFAPKEKASRAQAAVIMYKVFNVK